MALPTAMLGRGYRAEWWLEVEGWPAAVGTFSALASFFSGRATAAQFLGVLPRVRLDGDRIVAPEISPSHIDHLAGKASTSSMRLSLLDTTGGLHALCGTLRYDDMARLAADETASSTAWTLTGDLTAWGDAGVAYCGTECVTYTRSGQTLTVVRAQRRTSASAHAGTSATRRGDFVTAYPRSVVGRRCWLRYWAGTAGVPTDADAITVFAGRITDYAQDAHGGMTLDADDAQAQLRSALGGAWFRAQLADPAVPATLGFQLRTEQFDAQAYFVGLAPVAVADETGSRFLTLDAEIMLVEPTTTTDGDPWDIVRRGALTGAPTNAVRPFGTAALPTYIVGGPRASERTDFASDHPLGILLAFLTSTGTGANGSWDTLPAAWGLAIPAADVDVAGIESLIAQAPMLAATVPLWAAIPDFRAWACSTLLQPFGFYLTSTSTGDLSVRAIRSPTTDETTSARALTLADVVRDAGTGLPMIGEAHASDEAVVRSAEWADSPILRAGPTLELPDPQAVPFAEDSDFSELHKTGTSASIEALGLHATNPAPGGICGVGTDAAAVREAWQQTIGSRYQSPAVLLDVTLGASWLDVSPGDFINVTLAGVPNAASATRGLSAEICECWGRKADLTRGLVTLTLAQTGAVARYRRLLAPAVVVASRSGGALTLAAGEVGTWFQAGQQVRLYSSDLTSRSSQGIVASVAAGSVVISDPGDLGASGVLLLDDQADTRAADLARYAYRADATEMLDEGAPPHVYAE